MTSDQRTNPPPGIENEILEYLHLEFGEDKDDPDALQAAELKYVGAREDGEAWLHFWEYPSGSGKSWAIARVTKDGYELYTSLEGPSGERNDPLAALSTLVVQFGTRKKGQKRLEALRVKVADIKDSGVPVRFPTGEEIFFYAEVHPASENAGPDVSVQVLQQDDVVLAIRCTSGVIISLSLAGYDCLISLGTGPWDA
jgi:hypothetical protein